MLKNIGITSIMRFSLTGALALFLTACPGSDFYLEITKEGIVITQTGFNTSVTEGGVGDTYDVKLKSDPGTSVVVAVTPDAQVLANGSNTAFTYTFTGGDCPGTGDWCIPRTITVDAVDDTDKEGQHSGYISHDVTSGPPEYDGLPAKNLRVSVTDNDVAGVRIVSTTMTISEGGSGAYTVVLNAMPSDVVNITIAPVSGLTIAPSTLVFDGGNWGTAQMVTVIADDNFINDGDRTLSIGHSCSSADPDYNNFPASDVNVTILDDDTAGVTLNAVGITLNEGDVMIFYTIVLDSDPGLGNNVIISLNWGPWIEVGGSTTPPLDILFTGGMSGTWQLPQPVSVLVLDDLVNNGNRTDIINHTVSSGPSEYTGIPIPQFIVDIIEDDP